MSGNIFKILIAYFIVFISLSDAQEKRYDVKSGIVEYEIKGSGNMLGFETKENGVAKLIFKDWGNLELDEEKISTFVMGGVEKSHMLTKIDGDTVYTVDFEHKVIYKSKISNYFAKNKDISRVGKDMLKKMGGKKIGQEKFLGYKCEIWEFMGTKVWIYKGVVLKSEGNLMGMKYHKEAVKAKFNIDIPNDKFKLPNFSIKDFKETFNENISTDVNEWDIKEKSKEFEDFMKNFKNLMNK